MKRIFSLLLVLTLEFVYAAPLSFGEESTTTLYRVRFLSAPKSLSEQKILQSIPAPLRKKTKLIAKKDYYVAVYNETASLQEAHKNLQVVKKFGYKDAYIRKKTLPMPKEKKHHTPKSNLSKYQLSNIAFKANSAYKARNYMQAMMYYEMLLAAGSKSTKVKNNLCYLYGRVGAFEEAQRLFQSSRYPSQLIYAYASGAVTTQQKEYYKQLSPYILIDHSGRLMLLTAYYFEQQAKEKKAATFYEMAYKQNPADPYIIFAYARSLDIEGKRAKAIQHYKEVCYQVDEESRLYKVALKRIKALGASL